jgi:hypothetical protein
MTRWNTLSYAGLEVCAKKKVRSFAPDAETTAVSAWEAVSKPTAMTRRISVLSPGVLSRLSLCLHMITSMFMGNSSLFVRDS